MVDRPMSRRRGSRARAVAIVVVVLAILSISTIVNLFTEVLWFREVGFSQVFFGILKSKVLLAASFGLTFFLFLTVNLLVAGRAKVSDVTAGPDPLDQYRRAFLPYFRLLSLGGSAVLAFLFAIGLTSQWERFLLFRNAVDFGSSDPVFGKDIGFYVFKLPMLQTTYGWLFSSLVVTTLLVAGAHFLRGGIRPQLKLGGVSPAAKAHLSILVGLMALLRAWGYRLGQFGLLYSNRGDVSGASFTDINAELPALKLLVVAAVIVAVLVFINIRLKGWILPLAGVGLLVLVSALAGGLYPFLIQKFRVDPAQLQKEGPFIQRNIDATRDAYGLSSIEVQQHPVEAGLSPETAASHTKTIENIRLFDPAILKRSYSSLQEIRPYYTFTDVDVDRYTIGGVKRQVMLSARELTLANIATPSWQNTHLFYTHGYGAVVSPTNQATSTGQPKFLVENIPPVSQVPELEIKQGGIYFGEAHSDYSLVKTKQEELDFGRQESNQLTRYSGRGGVEISGLGRRLAFAWRFRNVNLLISGLIEKDSRIIYNRQIRERLTKAAPFLAFDGDPYPVIVDGRIIWMADGYTKTAMYPYSLRTEFAERTVSRDGVPTMTGRNNYLRNSVKATIDAYDGTVNLYQWDEQDPLIRAWRKAFPTLFQDASKMPAALREHVRYPEDLFRIQTHLYRLYHVTKPATFLFGEDQWAIPRDPNAAGGGQALSQQDEIQPYYVLMKLPGEESEQYVLILPMNPNQRKNMVAYFAAKSGPENYGELSDFRFPKTRQIDGVSQFHSKFQQIPSIASQITLLNQRGSRIAFGNLLVIPLGQSILYVQPLFLEAEGNALPELKLVILGTSNRIVIGTTLEDAVSKLLEGGDAPVITGPGPGGEANVEGLVRSALDHLIEADKAARGGDWAAYGREQEAARRDLEEAKTKSSTSPSPSPSPSRSP